MNRVRWLIIERLVGSVAGSIDNVAKAINRLAAAVEANRST